MAQILTTLILLTILIIRFYIGTQTLKELWVTICKWLKPHKDVKLFYDNYIDVKAFYLKEYGSLPCINFVCNIDSTKVAELINGGNYGQVLAVYQRNYYHWQNQRAESSKIIFKLKNKIVVEISHEYAEILYDNISHQTAKKMFETFTAMKVAPKEVENEINIITLDRNGLDLKSITIKPVNLNMDLFYNEDFKPVDSIIRERLGKENDKGIILLHGLPGTGKTTYLRHLVAGINKRVLFVSPSVAGNLMNPEFIDLLIDNPNSVLVVEDAENIIMDRKYSSNSSVSNLLNLSDGLMSDCLNVQIICTFNSSLTMVDSALMRKGRLIAKYEFGKLEASKAQLLSDHLGLKQKIDKPMTLAEITNPGEPAYKTEQLTVIGFRRQDAIVN